MSVARFLASIAVTLLPALGAGACSQQFHPYSANLSADFKARCVEEFGRLHGPPLPRDVVAARCDCVLAECQNTWGPDEFEDILFTISRGGYSQRLHLLVSTVPTPTTFPAEILDMMQECSKRQRHAL